MESFITISPSLPELFGYGVLYAAAQQDDGPQGPPICSYLATQTSHHKGCGRANLRLGCISARAPAPPTAKLRKMG
jgi:hypothetical protein